MHYLGLPEYCKILVLSKTVFREASQWYSHYLRETKPSFTLLLPAAVAFCNKYHLNYVDLGNYHIFEGEITHIQQLKHPVLFRAFAYNVSAVIAELSQKTELKVLNVSGPIPTKISHTDCSKISRLTQLEHLDVSFYTGISDESLYEFRHLTRLRHLNLRSCNFTDKGVPALTAFASLQILLLYGTRITDASFPTLKQMTTLTKLQLSGNSEITDAGVSTLSSLPHLEILELAFCDKITGAFLLAFKDSATLSEVLLEYCRSLNKAKLLEYPVETPAFRRIFTGEFRMRLTNPLPFFY